MKTLATSKQIVGRLLAVAFCAFHLGCDREPATEQLDVRADIPGELTNKSLSHIDDRWVYRFTVDGKSCATVGEGVSLTDERLDADLVVDIGGSNLLNVPLSGQHRLRVVTQAGIEARDLDVDQFPGEQMLLNEVLGSRDGDAR